jgi:alginate O-acetyltransferase complex protein AlgI
MLFNSLPFLFVFLPVTYWVFWRLEGKRQRYVWLTLTGYVFYSFWNYKFCALLLFSTTVSFLAGLGLLRWRTPGIRRLLLVVPITVDLLILGFFKYVDFALDSLSTALSWVSISLPVTPFNILLPIGISFYTFHNISYMVDAYRGTITPTRSFWEYACYVSLFSQLVAGPIVRFREIEQDLDRIDQHDRLQFLDKGWSFFAIGMVQKVLIADTIASVINPGLDQYSKLSTLDTWLCMLGYAYQLYFDFSGYSNMAVGLGFMFGLHIPQNFNSPYQARNIADFWRRWHMSLFSCLRDYVYIPLGGNRGSQWQVSRNLMLTMFLGGLWHGANWTFVCWGLYHGVLLVMYRTIGRPWDRLPVLLQQAGTFVLVVIGWVLFRAESVGMAGTLLGKMFLPEGGVTLTGVGLLSCLLLIAGAAAHLGPNTFEMKHEWNFAQASGLAVLLLASVFFIYGGQPAPFLYFQF